MKKAHILATVISGLVCMNQAMAEVKLMVDDNIKVTAINGKEVRHGALQPLKREFKLDAGRHVITARYDRLFDLTRDSHDYLKSDNISITAELQDNQTYQLIMPNQPNSYSSAKEYAKTPSLAIAQNGKILVQENATEQREGIFSSLGSSIGGIFGRNNDAVIANQKVIASIDGNQSSTPSSMPKAKDNLDGFMQLWLNASEEEREKIRQWVQK